MSSVCEQTNTVEGNPAGDSQSHKRQDRPQTLGPGETQRDHSVNGDDLGANRANYVMRATLPNAETSKAHPRLPNTARCNHLLFLVRIPMASLGRPNWMPYFGELEGLRKSKIVPIEISTLPHPHPSFSTSMHTIGLSCTA